MSDNIPIEIQIEIMKKLPVKPLLQFRSVSKAWKSMIDSSRFVARYKGPVQHLLVNHHDFRRDEPSFHHFISFVDDDTFPQQKVSPFVPEWVKMLGEFSVIGCSHGLLCLDAYGFYSKDNEYYTHNESRMAVLWNISIRKTVAVVVPYGGDGYRNVLGFGVCGETNDPKIVKIKNIDNTRRNIEIMSDMPWQVEVFTLSTGAWRNVSNNLPRMSTELCHFHSQVVIDEFLYWLATDRVTTGSEYRSYIMIILFDITREEFRKVNLPDSLAQGQSHENLYMSKRTKSLVVVERDGIQNNPSFIVWMMKDGISESFTKLYTIHIPDAKISNVLVFKKNDEPILELSERREGYYEHSMLVAYEPYTKRIENTGIDETCEVFYVYSYVETLHLFDQPNFIIYDKVNVKHSSLEEV